MIILSKIEGIFINTVEISSTSPPILTLLALADASQFPGKLI